MLTISGAAHGGLPVCPWHMFAVCSTFGTSGRRCLYGEWPYACELIKDLKITVTFIVLGESSACGGYHAP